MIPQDAELTDFQSYQTKNQVTVPKPIVDAVGLAPGDRLLFIVSAENPDVMQVHRIRSSYAGALVGVYGTPEEVRAFLEAEREAWGE